MPNPYIPLEPGGYYHIYNRANGKENLFREEANYLRFLGLYEKYISPVADTLAWVLMANHFHLLVRMKEGIVYKYSKEDFSSSSTNADRYPGSKARANAVGLNADAVGFEDVKWETVTNPSASTRSDDICTDKNIKRKIPNPTRHFCHLCNAYAKYINEKYDRHGSLFQRPFKRKPVEDDYYLQQVILYIHNNPVHHGFVTRPDDYPWSSYHTCLSDKPTKLKRGEVLDCFDNKTNFKTVHRDYSGCETIETWLEEEEKQTPDQESDQL